MASVLLADTRPAATLVMVRCAEPLPTLTVPTGELPATLYFVPLTVMEEVETAVEVVAPEPKATELAVGAVAP